MFYPAKYPRLSYLLGNLLPLVPYFWNRLKCPHCVAIGTFAPHGHSTDFMDTRKVPRWLCKWCGYYWSQSEGTQLAAIADLKCWELQQDIVDRGVAKGDFIQHSTPRVAVWNRFESEVNPWAK